MTLREIAGEPAAGRAAFEDFRVDAFRLLGL
jgi:hypothetical protein